MWPGPCRPGRWPRREFEGVEKKWKRKGKALKEDAEKDKLEEEDENHSVMNERVYREGRQESITHAHSYLYTRGHAEVMGSTHLESICSLPDQWFLHSQKPAITLTAEEQDFIFKVWT